MIVHARPDPARHVLASLSIGLAFGLLFALFADCGNIADSQDRVTVESHGSELERQARTALSVPSDGAVALAQSCWGEAGVSPHECAAIGAVYRRRSPSGEITPAIVRAYSAAVRPSTSRPWLLELDADGSRPASWPSHLDWERWRPRWLGLLGHAERVVSGEVEAACEPDHYGARYGVDMLRAHRAGWTRVDCGNTANLFWRVR
jgi:hypothetical protein